MLRALLCLAIVALVRASAAAQDDDVALRRPERLTIGLQDQFLGQLAPDQETLYFVSNQETRKEIFVQDGEDGHARRLFDEGAEVTWPRVSPDGRSLLYISFSGRAAGQLCVRALPKGEDRRCFAETEAALQAEWIDPTHILLVGRTSIHGDLTLFRVEVGERLTGRPLFERNWTSPAISPDGRWLVYVPLDRVTTRVGPGFAARAAPRLEAVRLDRPGTPVPLSLDLPGMTGQPAFSRDGEALYFVQFFSDTNHDGLLDASDHGVLFRVPFPAQADDAPLQAAAALPLQITDSGWNCQYPAPAAQKLIATCARRRKLDIYELPLDGEVPPEWDLDRLRLELSLGARHAEQLMLYRHTFGKATKQVWRRLLMMRLVMVHLEHQEFDAAEFYAKKVAALRDPDTRGIAQPLLALIAQRRARAAQGQGRTVDRFTDEALARMEALRDGPKDSAAARVLNRVVRSEIADALGDKAQAREELAAAEVDERTPRAVLELYFARADALYRSLDDREALVQVARHLATLPGLAEDARLDYARAAVRAMVRGLPFEEADARLARELEAHTAQDELTFALALGRLVLAIRDGRPGRELRDKLLALYDAQERADRKRAIVFDAVQRAAALGADGILEGIAERYVDDVAQGTGELRRAQQLYRRALLGRAYRRLARDRTAEAQADFEAVFRRTGSLEALVGLLDLRLAEGRSPEGIERELALVDTPELAHFARAYLIACELGQLQGEPRDQASRQARTLLREAWGELRHQGPARALLGALRLEEYLRTGAPAAAEAANLHLMVALELTRNDPRYRARVLGQLAVLHTQAGNYRIALGHIEEREQLPFKPDAEALAVRLAKARALLHVHRVEESAAAYEQALSLVEATPALSTYLPLVLDRSALSNLAAGRFERALALYDREVPLLTGGEHPEPLRNSVVVPLARAAAAIGANQPRRALDDLEVLAPRLDERRVIEALSSEHMDVPQTARFYRGVLAGLRANAHLALGELDAVDRALSERRTQLLARVSASEREEDLRALVLVEARLAENANRRGDREATARWLELSLTHSDALVRRTATPLDPERLRLLRFASHLQTSGQTPAHFDVSARLRAAQQELIAARNPALRSYQRSFEVYLAMLNAPRALRQNGAQRLSARRP